MNKTANIIGHYNGGGLSRDIDVLRTELVQLGWSVVVNAKPKRLNSASSVGRLLGGVQIKLAKMAVEVGISKPTFDLNLHFEEIDAECIRFAKRNILIPNQEWFQQWQCRYLSQMDEVWVKTRVAERAFSKFGCKVRFMGWASVDRRVATLRGPKTLTALHIAGRSRVKGTEAILDVWGENPQWPVLRVLRSMHAYDGQPISWRSRPSAPNIQIISERVDERTLGRLQNESSIHLCPSEVEGFGHIIQESTSVGAVVIVTDAPPMNEMITPATGILVAAERSEPMRLGRRYFVDRADLARQINAVLGMTDEQRESLGRAARLEFEQSNAAFRVNLKHYLESIYG